ncbi:hypothetical protein EXIGLDRAFT_760625 [Exidia glandulosa HHB12029]|uniref:DUF659 domain-containing protein n=1 Tax=Exidia glandulosa HHB12029 TaxID=1314781 RepID=A0A166BJR2_EXIGL|nr:hypothetical protein EXIGLDRAFT_760625 [Exidia glandulosa HHB12029]
MLGHFSSCSPTVAVVVVTAVACALFAFYYPRDNIKPAAYIASTSYPGRRVLTAWIKSGRTSRLVVVQGVRHCVHTGYVKATPTTTKITIAFRRTLTTLVCVLGLALSAALAYTVYVHLYSIAAAALAAVAVYVVFTAPPSRVNTANARTLYVRVFSGGSYAIAVHQYSTVRDVLVASARRLGIATAATLSLYSSAHWTPLSPDATIVSLGLDALSHLTLRVQLPGGAGGTTSADPAPGSTSTFDAADDWDKSITTPAKLDYLTLLLSNLPGTIPTASTVYVPYRYAPDPDWVEQIGCVKGALNRQLKIVFGPRCDAQGKPRMVVFVEQGPGLVALVDHLRTFLVEMAPAPADGILVIWVDNLITSARGSFVLAGQPPPSAKRVSRPSVKRKAAAADPEPDTADPTSPRPGPSKRARTGKSKDEAYIVDLDDGSETEKEDDGAENDVGEESEVELQDVPRKQRVNHTFADLEDLPEPVHDRGRPAESLYRRLTILCQVRGDPKRQRYRCASTGCEQNWAGKRQGGRIYNHILNECKFVTPSVRQEVIAASSEKSLAAKTSSASAGPSTTSSASPAPPGPPAFQAFSRAAQEARRDQIRHAVLTFLTAALLPPAVVDLEEWKTLLKVLDAKADPVSSTTISDIQLVHESAHALQSSLNELRELRNLTLTMDGGGTRAPQSLYTSHVTTPVQRRSHLIAGVEDSGASHTGEWVKQIALDVINMIGSDRFAAFVTDSAGNVKLGRKLIAQAFPTILSLNDQPHGMNNTIKDICQLAYFKSVISLSRRLLAYFKRSSYAIYHLKAHQYDFGVRRGLESIGKTRFSSINRSATSILRNIEPIKTIVRADNLLTSDKKRSAGFAFLRHPTLAGTYELQLRQLVAVLTPLAKALKCLESSRSTLADVYLFWLAAMATTSDIFTDHNNELHLPEDVIADIRRIINRRFVALVDSNPVYKAGLFLHPGYIDTSILRKRNINPFAAPARNLSRPSASRPDDDLRRTFPFYVDVGKFLGEQLKVHLEANQPSSAFAGFTSGQEVAAAFRAQLMAYTRRQAPFDLAVAEPLKYWRKLSNVPDARVLAFLGVKLFSVLPNDMPEERTMSLATKVNAPQRAAMKTSTIVNFVRVKQHNDREKPKKEKVPTILWFRELAAHIQAEVVPPSSGKNSAAPTSADAATAGTGTSANPTPALPADSTTAPAASPTANRDACTTSGPNDDDDVDVALGEVESAEPEEEVDEAYVPGDVFVPEECGVDLCSPLLLDLLSDVPVAGATRAAAAPAAAAGVPSAPLDVTNVAFFL